MIERFGQYMMKHQVQADGTLRSSRNWQKGIPLESYMSSMWRHFFEVWMLHEAEGSAAEKEEALCALFFNVQGYLDTLRKEALGW